MQLCTGLEAGIGGATHAVGQRRLERVRGRRDVEETGYVEEEEETERLELALHNLIIETAGIEEEAAERLEATMNM